MTEPAPTVPPKSPEPPPEPKPVIDVTPVVKPSVTSGVKAPATTAAKRAEGSAGVAWTCATLAALLAASAWLPWMLPQVAAHLPTVQNLQTAAPAPAMTTSQTTTPNAVGVLQDADRQISELATQITDLKSQRADDSAALSVLKEEATQKATEQATAAASETAQKVAGQIAGQVANQTAHDTAIKAVAPLLAVTRIEDRIARGAAYQSELGQLQPLLGDGQRSDLAALSTGGPDSAALLRQLDDHERSLLSAYRESTAIGWWEKIKARLSGLVTITSPDSAPDAATASYARLRAQVAQDDDTAALATIRMLPQPVHDGLATVESALTARARAQGVLSDLLAQLTSVAPVAASAIAPVDTTAQ